MASQTHLLLSGDPYYLAGKGVAWNGVVSEPWDNPATTPFKISLARNTPYTPTVPQPIEVWRGGPPFRMGSDLGYRGYGLVDETIGIQAYATSHDRAVALLRIFKQQLIFNLSRGPVAFAVRPEGATEAVYFEVLSASLQETPEFTNQESRTSAQSAAGAVSHATTTIQWRRTPFGGRLSSGQNMASASSITNNRNSNVLTYALAGKGDLINEGQPLNMLIDSTATPWAAQNVDVFVATVLSGGVVSTANTSTLVTSSTTGVLAATISSVSVSSFLTRPNLLGRVMLRATSASTNLELQVRIALTGGAVFYSSEWVRATPSGSVNVLVDMGRIPIPIHRLNLSGSPTISIFVYARSTNGSPTVGSLAYVEWLPCHTFGGVRGITMSNKLTIESFVARTDLAALPTGRTRAYTDALTSVAAWRGSPPIYLQGSSLYLAWRTTTANTQVTTEQALVTVDQAPLYASFRGND